MRTHERTDWQTGCNWPIDSDAPVLPIRPARYIHSSLYPNCILSQTSRQLTVVCTALTPEAGSSAVDQRTRFDYLAPHRAECEKDVEPLAAVPQALRAAGAGEVGRITPATATGLRRYMPRRGPLTVLCNTHLRPKKARVTHAETASEAKGCMKVK